jgi:FkbM family methyltransferase
MSLKNEILKIIRLVANPVGYDIVKYKTTYPAHIVLNHLNRNNIKTVLDVGANEGQYSYELRKAGYRGCIISFEPLSRAYQQLRLNAEYDKNWQTFNFALGDTNGTTSIHISRHSPSSSLLPMTSLHSEAAPGSEYLTEEEIEIKTLDTIFDTLRISDGNVFLKVDTQGYEKKVLVGAINSLLRISGIQLELSTTELYEGEENYYSLCRFVEERDFHLVRVIPGFSRKGTQEMLQFDAIFFKK